MTRLREIDAPFLELNFYIPNLPETESFMKLVAALIDLDANFTGKGKVHRGPGVRDKPFASITDELLQPVTVENMEDLVQYLGDKNTRLLQVNMSNATGTVFDASEIITFVSISSEAMNRDRHPLAIWTEGWSFSGSPSFRNQHKKQTQKVGIQIYKRFRKLVEVLRPAYAAITNEYSLECPTDLRLTPPSYAFRDFYVSQTYLDPKKLVDIEALFSGAYIEMMGDGIYISTSEVNPKGQSISSSDFSKQSVEVGKIIASVK